MSTTEPTKNRSGLILLIIAAIPLLLAAMLANVWAHKGVNDIASAYGCDVETMQLAADEPARSEADRAYLRQEIKACLNFTPVVSTSVNTDTSTTTTSAASTTTSSAPASSSASNGGGSSTSGGGASSGDGSTSSASTPEGPVEGVGQDGHKFVYNANKVPTDPKLNNSFAGDHVAQDPSLSGKELETLTLDEAKREMLFRCNTDPMFAIAIGMQLAIIDPLDEDAQQAGMQALIDHSKEWGELCAEVDRVLTEDYEITLDKLPAGNYLSTYAISNGGAPIIAVDTDVYREKEFKVIKLKRKSDGHIEFIRLYCGFQRYVPNGQPPADVPQLPPPSKCMDRDSEGNPIPDEKCKPPVTTTTATGGGHPSSTPTSTSSTTTKTTSTTTKTTTTTSPPVTTTTKPSCPPDKPHGTYPVCKDSPSDGPATVVPTEQRPNPLPASPEMEESDAPDVPAPTGAYTPPAGTSATAAPQNHGGPTANPNPRDIPAGEEGAPQ